MTSLSETSILTGASGQSTGYAINQSVRFEDGDSPFLIDPNSNAGDSRKTFTFSGWFKLCNLGINRYVYSYRYDNNNNAQFYFNTDDQIELFDRTGGSTQMQLKTNRVFRDISSWYHFVIIWDTTQLVASQRAQLYINGQRESSFATETYPSQNADSGGANRAAANMRIGTFSAGGSYFDGYMAELHYFDNEAFSPSSFGEFKEDTDIWIPKKYEGADSTYGSNGFYFEFANSSALGANTKGKGNYTSSGLASSDQVLDAPTNNFSVYNILYNVGDLDFPTYTEGSLSVDFNNYGKRSPVSTFALPTDSDAYCEFYIKTSANNNSGVGIGQEDTNNAGNVLGTNCVTYNTNGLKLVGSTSSFGATYTAGDIIGVLYNQSGNSVQFFKNNSSQGTISLSSLSGDLFFIVANNTTAQIVIIANFGQDDTFAGNKSSGSAGASDASGNGNFYYSPPSGAKALCSKSIGS